MADWKQSLGKFIHRVERKLDEQREKHGLFQGRGTIRVEPYRGYGCADRAYLKGRVLRGAAVPAAAEGQSVLVNLASMIQRFESDEVSGAKVRVVYAGGQQVVAADEEGYFEVWLHPDPPFGAHALWHEVALELVEPAVEGAEPPRALGHILVPPPQAAFGVISDLDDTVVRTDATSTIRMARNVLLTNARTRVPFPGVAAFYRALQQGTGETPFNPIFYVSSSPWNIHDLLSEFLTLQQIPIGPLLLRDWGISAQETLPTGHAGHKLEAIKNILSLLPALPFVLIGDSGQEDPEIYHRVVHDYPDRIRAVYIRNVTPHPERAFSIRKLAAEVEKAGSTLILADDTLAAAQHAASKGWITEQALAEVAQSAQAQERPTPAGTAAVNRELSTDASE